jgi:beta-phosphoglucomutase family hydrolase
MTPELRSPTTREAYIWFGMASPVTANGEVSWPAYDAVLFDLDGVLTPTADLHQQAWREMFEQFLDEYLGPDHAPYTEADYLAYVDGKPRFDGVRSFLTSRGILLPEGNRDEPPGSGSISALGNRKNAVFQELLRTNGIAPYPGSIRLLDHLAGLGIPAAVVSSSRNAREVLEAAGLADRFEVVADGVVAAERGIPGKPAPDLFLAAAEELGVPPEKAVVVEDALSGVAAGRAGGFGLVVGVDRGAGRAALAANGADVVVDDLAELVPDGTYGAENGTDG